MRILKCTLFVAALALLMAACTKPVEVSFTVDSQEFEPQGGTVEIGLKSNGDWTVDAYPEWLTVSATSGNGDATLTLTASLNDTEATRTGELLVSTKDNSAKLMVTQGAMEKDYIVVTPNSIESEAEGGTFTLAVTSNCDWGVNTSAEWIACEPESGSGNGIVTVTVLPIEGDIEFRETNIIFSGAGNELHPVHVLQHAGVQIYLSLNHSTLFYDYEGGAQTVTVLSNGSWTASYDANWFTLNTTSGNGDAELTVNVAENESMEARVAFVTFHSEVGDSIQLSIKQDGAPDPHYLEVTPETLAFDKNGGTAEITISCDEGWTAMLEESWASLSATTGTGDGTITVIAAPNTINEGRHADVTVVSGSLSRRVVVTQAPGEDPVSVSINPDTLFVSASGGLQHISITANSSWRLVSSYEWISFITSSGTGNAELDIIVDINESSEGRLGSFNIMHGISVMGTVVVVQEGRPNIFETDIEEIDARPEGGTYTVHITANQSWNIETSADWVTCTPSSGNNNGEFTVKVLPLTMVQPRSTELRIYGGSGGYLVIPVTQSN